MKNMILFVLITAIILMTSALLVNAVSDEEVEKTLKRMLLEHLDDPTDTTLEIDETKDLIEFYLTVPEGQETVDLGTQGVHSNQQIKTIFSKAVQGKPEAKPIGRLCNASWRCKTNFHRAYQKADCTWQATLFCEGGCSAGQCSELLGPPQNQTNTTNQTGTIYATSTPSGAYIYINNTYKGTTPKTISGLTIGTKQVKFRKNNYNDYLTTTIQDAQVIHTGDWIMCTNILEPQSIIQPQDRCANNSKIYKQSP